MTEQALCPELLADRDWRLSHLYWIVDKGGNEVLFEPNPQQRELLDGLHNRNLVPKSRQHGISTLAAILALDTALFRSNTSCGIVMHEVQEAVKLFKGKILFAYNRLPQWLRDSRPIVRRNETSEVEFDNGSKITVSGSHRGGTLQFLHVSEFGPMGARYPQRAKEVKAGALNTVSPDGIVTIESTSAGGFGDFHDMCKEAMDLEALVRTGDAVLSPMDYKLHFFAWWQDAGNQVDPIGVLVTKEDEDYFAQVEAQIARRLTPAQRAWYVKKKREQQEDMLREHPSTIEEAFKAAIEGAYYAQQMAQARGEGRIGRVPHVPGCVVNTFWDLGFGDTTALWFHQQQALENRFIRSYQRGGEHLPHFAQYLQQMSTEHGYVYGTHYLPHDAESSTLASKDVLTLLREMMPGQKFVVVPRTPSVWTGIQQTRQVFATCYFDAVNCADGIQALDAYRKHFDPRHGIFTSEPEHDEFSNFADAFRQFGQGYEPARRIVKPPAWQERIKAMHSAKRGRRSPMSA